MLLTRRRLAKPWGLQRPPLASATLMLLLCLSWLTGIGENLALVPSQLTRPSQAHRLVTYCLCHPDATHLLFDLLLFPLLGWRQELQRGTLGYLHTSALGAAVSALLYVLLAGLWGAPPGAVVAGYTPVHLAMLGCSQRRQEQRRLSGQILAALLPALLLGLSQTLLPQPPLLLHLSGLLTGLAWTSQDRTGILSPLELSERRLERLHEGIICRTLAGWSPLHFVAPSAARILPTVDPAARRERIPSAPDLQAWQLSPDFSMPPLSHFPPPVSHGGGEQAGLGQEWVLPYASGSLPALQAPYGGSDVPLTALQESLMDDTLLQAGIRASLQDMTEGEVKLSKSSVSSFRLQQLQKMGFPTEQAVVALAATGRVEGAVSLLIGGHVGDEAVVMSESQAAHHKRPSSGGKP